MVYQERPTESGDGAVLFKTDPIVLKWHYEIDYIHSYAQDSPFFTGLSQGKLMGSGCTRCRMKYATPRGHCMACGAPTEWIRLPLEGKVHTFTTCHFGGEAFLSETPFTLILVEFEGVESLFLSRLIGIPPAKVKIGLPVKARFRRLSRFQVTDVSFVPVGPVRKGGRSTG